MFIKLLLSTPVAAFVGYLLNSISAINIADFERMSMDLIVLGRIPGTEVIIDYEAIMVGAIVAAWVLFVAACMKSAVKFSKKTNIRSQIEAIAL